MNVLFYRSSGMLENQQEIGGHMSKYLCNQKRKIRKTNICALLLYDYTIMDLDKYPNLDT